MPPLEESSVVLTSATEQWRRSLGERFVKISYNRFMQEFGAAPPDGTTKPNYRSSFMGMPRGVRGVEAGMLLEHFHKCLQRHRLHPGYKLVAMRLEDEEENEDGDEAGSVSTEDKTRRLTNSALFLDDEAPDDGGACWTRQGMMFKFVRDDEDPFEDEVFDEGCLRCRRHLISCAENIFSYQHRAFCFSVLIFGNHARLLRWDRCGALFTEKFNFRQDPDKLGEFLWRFSQMSQAQQGYDSTVTRVEKDSPDYLLMKRLASKSLKTGNYVCEYFEKSLDECWPWWKVCVDPDEDKVQMSVEREDTAAQAGPSRFRSTARYFLVGRPWFKTSGLASRGMRGYVAVDCQTDKLVFLKDTWRCVLPGIRKEGDILKMLNAHDVANVPTLVCHGDVSGQTTVTDEYWNTRHPDDDSTHPTMKQLHYRLVVAEVGRPLHDFRTGKELVMILSDCIEAHRQAYEKCQIVHFDISAGNILIMESSQSDTGGVISVTFTGLLTDWEISKVALLDGPAEGRRRTHMGTWQFLSATTLSAPERGIRLADELESFFHVLLYYSIKYLPHNLTDVRSFKSDYFDGHTFDHGKPRCGHAKRAAMRMGTLMHGPTDIRFGQPASREGYPLHFLVTKWLSWFRAFYHVYFLERPQERSIVPSATRSNVPDAELSSSARAWQAYRRFQIQRRFGAEAMRVTDEEAVARQAMQARRQAEEESLKKAYQEEAKNLDSHSPILALFRDLVRMTWPEDDKQPNQVPWEGQKANRHRKRQLDVEDMPLSDKRTKLAHSGDAAAVVSSQARLPLAKPLHPIYHNINDSPSSDSNVPSSVSRPIRRLPTRRDRNLTPVAASNAQRSVEQPPRLPRPTGTRISSRLAAQRNKLAVAYERRSDGGARNDCAIAKRTRNRGRH